MIVRLKIWMLCKLVLPLPAHLAARISLTTIARDYRR